ncbi:MAG: DUF692 domain-containing protein [Burkholderiales bacterium]
MAARFPERAPDPAKAGIGLRTPHFEALATTRPPLSFLEVHSENYFADGGPSLAWLERLRADYPVSLHGVGLSLGSADPLDDEHLARLARLARRIEPALVSEHLCWSGIGGRHLNELLPLPLTEEVLAHVGERVARVQDRLGRRILVENVTAYVRFSGSTIAEGEFLSELARRTGCGVLLDVNNAWINAVNHGTDARAFLEAIDPACVGEIHLAGGEATPDGIVDSHGAAVFPEVWELFARTVARLGPVPTLIEWDTDIPALDVLVAEARRADAILAGAGARREAA